MSGERPTHGPLREVSGGVDGGVCAATECIVETGEPAEVIVRVAEERMPDVLVLGAQPPTILSNHLGWSTAYRVVQGAPCPVLTISTVLRRPDGANPPRKQCVGIEREVFGQPIFQAAGFGGDQERR